MDVFEAIKTRRAIRQYRPDPVSREDILAVLDAANRAPSAMNRQQWEFVVVTGEKIRKMGESFCAIMKEYTKNWDISPMRGSLTRNDFLQFALTYGGAPVVIVVLTDADPLPNMQKANLESASAAMENLLLAATARGLGTCWMTGPLQDGATLRRILDIPDTKEIVAVTPLGHPLIIPGPPLRLDPDLTQKVRWVE